MFSSHSVAEGALLNTGLKAYGTMTGGGQLRGGVATVTV
jgi:hypothetical protein